MTRNDDRYDIDRLLASYALFYDSGDLDGCAALFMDDCEFVAGDHTIAGRDALRRYLGRVTERGATGIQLTGATLVDVADDGETAAVWQNFFFVRNGSNLVTRGMYRDLVQRDADRWRFRSRNAEVYPGPSEEEGHVGARR